MLDLYFAPTPNGLKIRLFMEETGLSHRLVPVRLRDGDQFRPAFLAISPNNKIPAIVDHDPGGGAPPLPLFESGAVLFYLANKIARLIPADLHGRMEVLQWLFWQTFGMGPTAGQLGYFRNRAPQRQPYTIDRLTEELRRLYHVLDTRLAGRDFIVREYSVADIACYPWIWRHLQHGLDLAEFPHVRRWFDAIRARPATIRTYADVADSH